MDFEVLLFFLLPFLLFCLCGWCCRSKQKGIIFQITDFPLGGFILFLLFIMIICMCSHCCRTERGAVYRTPVVVTSATHTAPGGYPGAVQSASVYPTASSGYQQTPYPQQAPYPIVGVQTAMPMPMQNAQMNPTPAGVNPQVMPPYPTNAPVYPPGTANFNYTMNPPSYESAVATNQPTGYEKQAPYNPGYTAGY